MHNVRDLLKDPGAKEHGKLRVLRTVMARPGHQSELAKRAELSNATVSDAVQALRKAGIVTVLRTGRESLVSLAPTEGLAVGVELGYIKSIIVARRFHLSHEQARSEVLSVGAVDGPGVWVPRIVERIVGLAGEQPLDIATIGLGVPRMVDPRTLALTPPVLPPWREGDNPAAALEAGLHAALAAGGARAPFPRVLLDNDANLGALAESTYRHAGAEIVLFVKASTGIGMGLFIGGKLLRGRAGVAGELGHVVVEPGGAFCQCGGRGCLETFIGSAALLAQAEAGFAGQDRPRTLAELIEAARRGNAVGRRVLSEAGLNLGRAMGNLCNLINPDVVVIGGTLATAGELVLEPCREGLRGSAMAAACRDGFQFVVHGLEHGVAHGALLLGIAGTTYKAGSSN